MSRIARENIKTPFLHVMVQGVNKEYIFNKESYIKMYLSIFNKYKQDYEITLIAYCIMNNHAHFLVYTEDIKGLGRFMQKVNLIYASKYNELESRVGVLFRNRYKTEPIEDRKYLLNCIKYIHNNPVKAGIVNRCEDYRYSSYNDYVKNIGIAKSDILKSIFGQNCNYILLFERTYDRIFMDLDEVVNTKYYIEERS